MNAINSPVGIRNCSPYSRSLSDLSLSKNESSWSERTVSRASEITVGRGIVFGVRKITAFGNNENHATFPR